MPELPEVETICRSLDKCVSGKTILNTEVLYQPLIKKTTPDDFTHTCKNKTIIGVKRIGKAICISLSGNYTIIVQLKMTGKFYLPENKQETTKHTRLLFTLSEEILLAFDDIRKFACVYLDTNKKISNLHYLQTLGVDPLTSDYTLEVITKALKRFSKKNIKSFLLDQHIVCGIGNIYASEILFHAKIDPKRTAGSLNQKEAKAIFKYIPKILKEAIKHKGTTFSDYRDVDGNKGNYLHKLSVYQRENQKCIDCLSEIENIKIGGRSSFFCPKCQK